MHLGVLIISAREGSHKSPPPKGGLDLKMWSPSMGTLTPSISQLLEVQNYLEQVCVARIFLNDVLFLKYFLKKYTNCERVFEQNI